MKTPVWTFSWIVGISLVYLQKYRSVHKMPRKGHLQGHSKISGRVLGYFGDIFSLILHGYESAEWHGYRKRTQ